LREGLVSVRDVVGTQFGWLYVASMTGFLLLCLWLATGPYRHVRLGRDDERPEFSRWSWFAMLFSAGMGIGLLFYSVAEPIDHQLHPPPGFADGLNESRLAMAVTIFHWGLHPWALYALVGMALGLAGFRYGLPLSFRSLLYPLLGDRVWGRYGDAIDVLAVIATLIGVATSLGIGARQINAGLTFLLGMPADVWTQTFLIGGITLFATLSVVTGLDGGIRRLSELNMTLATVLLLMVIGGGGLMATMAATVENTGAYLQVLPFNSLRTGAFSDEARDWLSGWTVFYWGLVDIVVTVCGPVHRQSLTRPNAARIRAGSDAGADCGGDPLADSVWPGSGSTTA
jgi:choline/glycine/proline betaine transport protein